LNILVVDDHPANRLLLCQQLGFLGHLCQTAEQGAQGLKLWLEGHFDLVIADCNMPVMSGYAMTRAIREYEATLSRGHCPVLGFTANAQPEEIERCREAGMDDCLFKPISLMALSERLVKIDALVPPAHAARPLVFNPKSLSALTADRPEMVQRMLEQLIHSSEQDRELLLALPTSGQVRPLMDIAHRIKGAARIVQATEVTELCEALEDACEEPASEQVVAARQQALGAAMVRFEQALQAHQTEIQRAAS